MATSSSRRRTIGQMRLLSIGTLTIALFILGAILLIRLVTLELGRTTKEQITFTVDLVGENPKTSFAYLQEQAQQIPGIKTLTYIDADQSAQELKHSLGEDPIEILGYNPLNSIAKLTLHANYMHTDSLKGIESALRLRGIDAQLDYRNDLLDSVDRNLKHIEWVMIGVLIIQICLAFMQINNTTKMTIYAQRLKIRTLSLVGASSWFICRPIIYRSVVDTLIASLIAIVCIGLMVSAIEEAWGMHVYRMLRLENIITAIGILTAIGLVSGFVSSARTAYKYIYMDKNKIALL